MADEKRKISVKKLPRKYRNLEKDYDDINEPVASYDIEPQISHTAASGRQRSRAGGIIGFLLCVCGIILLVVLVVVPMYTQPAPVRTQMPDGDNKFSIFMAGDTKNYRSDVDLKEILPQMRVLFSQNGDIAGWIKIEGTKIDYPVMYTPWDGEYYLYRTFEKENDATKQGCLFIDGYNTVWPRDTNLIVYGHNMKNGTMFNSLMNYQDEEYYEEHSVIEFNTLYAEEKYDIVAVFKSKVYNQDEFNVFKFYRFYNAFNQEMFDDFMKNIKELQLYDTGVKAEYGDELLTLVTCDESVKNGRLAVLAKKRT